MLVLNYTMSALLWNVEQPSYLQTGPANKQSEAKVDESPGHGFAVNGYRIPIRQCPSRHIQNRFTGFKGINSSPSKFLF
jgi:hypothetical protein